MLVARYNPGSFSALAAIGYPSYGGRQLKHALKQVDTKHLKGMIDRKQGHIALQRQKLESSGFGYADPSADQIDTGPMLHPIHTIKPGELPEDTQEPDVPSEPEDVQYYEVPPEDNVVDTVTPRPEENVVAAVKPPPAERGRWVTRDVGPIATMPRQSHLVLTATGLRVVGGAAARAASTGGRALVRAGRAAITAGHTTAIGVDSAIASLGQGAQELVNSGVPIIYGGALAASPYIAQAASSSLAMASSAGQGAASAASAAGQGAIQGVKRLAPHVKHGAALAVSASRLALDKTLEHGPVIAHAVGKAIHDVASSAYFTTSNLIELIKEAHRHTDANALEDSAPAHSRRRADTPPPRSRRRIVSPSRSSEREQPVAGSMDKGKFLKATFSTAAEWKAWGGKGALAEQLYLRPSFVTVTHRGNRSSEWAETMRTSSVDELIQMLLTLDAQ